MKWVYLRSLFVEWKETNQWSKWMNANGAGAASIQSYSIQHFLHKLAEGNGIELISFIFKN